MNRLIRFTTAAAAALAICSCDSHPWSTTQVLFKPHGAAAHGDAHAADGNAPHAPAPAHDAKKDEHGAKPKH